jgi:hypothetical protein
VLLPLLYSIVPAVLIGWALKGKLSGLAQLRLRWLWLMLAGFGVQVLAVGVVGRDWALVASNRPAIIIASYGLILAGLVRNWNLPGMVVVTFGFALNFAVIAANGGQMPVTREAIETSGQIELVTNAREGQAVAASKAVLLARDQTRLWALSDIFITPPPLRRAVSLGDVFAYAGMALVVISAMRRVHPGSFAPLRVAPV